MLGKYSGMSIFLDLSQHFSPDQAAKLKKIADHLTPYAEDIVNSWVDKQRDFESAPTIPREKLLGLFTMLFYGALDALRTGNISQYLSVQLPIIGKSLVESGFPYEHLVITIHFLEESYLPYLANIQVDPTSGKADIETYIAIDEFWHFWTAELTYSYFYEVRRTMSEEVEIGRSIQEAIIPRLPAAIGCIQIGTSYNTATTGARIGGDIYDIYDIDNLVQHVLLSDFSGSGLRAATKAANIRAMFRGFAIEDDSPLVIANRLNRALFSELAPNEFDTAFLARFDQKNRVVTYVNAGHLGPIVIGSGAVSVLPEGDSVALGMFKETTFVERTLTLDPDTTLIMYTDGITEARRGNAFFGVGGITKAARRHFTESPQAIASAIWNDCINFAEGKVEDDVAILVIRCT